MKASLDSRRMAFGTDTGSLAVTVSGSFHRHLRSINAAVEELASHGVRVLSPSDPRIVASQGEFLFVASDRVRSVRLVQDRHLDCIRAASFLWLVCPDGYVGKSASMELGFAAGVGVPVYAAHPPDDLTLRQYVTVVHSLTEALRVIKVSSRLRHPGSILINPHASVEEAHQMLERISSGLTRPTTTDESASQIYDDLLQLRDKLTPPTLPQ